MADDSEDIFMPMKRVKFRIVPEVKRRSIFPKIGGYNTDDEEEEAPPLRRSERQSKPSLKAEEEALDTMETNHLVLVKTIKHISRLATIPVSKSRTTAKKI